MTPARLKAAATPKRIYRWWRFVSVFVQKPSRQVERVCGVSEFARAPQEHHQLNLNTPTPTHRGGLDID